jgi:hypothetical protein
VEWGRIPNSGMKYVIVGRGTQQRGGYTVMQWGTQWSGVCSSEVTNTVAWSVPERSKED